MRNLYSRREFRSNGDFYLYSDLIVQNVVSFVENDEQFVAANCTRIYPFLLSDCNLITISSSALFSPRDVQSDHYSSDCYVAHLLPNGTISHLMNESVFCSASH